MSLQFDHTYSLDKSESETCLAISCVVKTVAKCNSRIRSLSVPFTKQFNSTLSTTFSAFATSSTATLCRTACPESSCSCFGRRVGFLGFILALGTSASNGSSSSSSVEIRNSVFDVNWIEPSSSVPTHKSFEVSPLFLANFAVHWNYETAVGSQEEIFMSFTRDFSSTAQNFVHQ